MAEKDKVKSRSSVPRRPVTLRVVLRTTQVLSWFAVYLAFLTLVLGPFLWVWSRLFDPQRRLVRKIVRAFYRHGMRGYCGKNMQIRPFNWSAISGPCMLIGNHQSAIDILLMFQLPPDGRCWSKDWPFHQPLLGWLMALSGHLRVEQPDIIFQALEALRHNTSLYIFPEGTRSRSHQLGRFHEGAFSVACQANVPVIPVAIHGSGDCMPPGQMAVFDVPLVVEPLGILYPDLTSPHPQRELRKQVRNMISDALARGPVPATAGPDAALSSQQISVGTQPAPAWDAAGGNADD
jgi:1-acyl-sn-glycerol-3-phosphate acyltransferase